MTSTPSTANSPSSQSAPEGQWLVTGGVNVSAPRMLGYTAAPYSRAICIPTSRGWSWSMYIETRSTLGPTTPSIVGNPAANLDTMRSAWEFSK